MHVNESLMDGLCDSLGWQGGDFAFFASFLILNEIMLPGVAGCGEAVPGRGAVHRGRDQPGPLCGQVRGSMRSLRSMRPC